MGIAPLLNDARRFLQLDFDLIKRHPHQMYDFAHVWIPKKSLVYERYAAILGHTPQVVFGLSQSWEPALLVIPHPSPWVNAVAFSPDGRSLASGSDEIVRIWSTATGELEDKLEGHDGRVESVAFSHDGLFIVSGSEDKTVRIWNTVTCETRYMLTHTSHVMSVAISKNSKFVVSSSWDGTVRIWDTATGEVLRDLKGQACGFVAVSPDCQHIAFGSHSEVWIGTKDSVIEHKLESTDTYLCLDDIAFSHDGRRILCNNHRTEWTITGRRLSLLDPDEYHDITSIAYSPLNDDEIVCGLKDGTIMIWERETNETHILGRHRYKVNSIAFSPNGSRMASGSSDGVRIWDPQLRGFTDEVDLRWATFALSHDGRWIVGAAFKHMKVWRVTETMTKMNDLIIEDNVRSLQLSHDNSHVVIGCDDGSIKVWNHLTSTIECQMSCQPQFVWSVAFSYDGSRVVSGSSDDTVRIWDCHTGNEVDLYQHSGQVMSVAFSCDGGCVAFGSYNGTWIWNPSIGRIYNGPSNKSEDMHSIASSHDSNHDMFGWMHSIAFSYDSNHVISGWREGGVWIWNVTTNVSTKLSERVQLPDGTRVHPLGKSHFHIYDPVDEETTYDISPYLLSISPDCDWITGEQGEHICWIAPQYRDFDEAHISKSIVCLASDSSMIVLDLKSTQHDERVMPWV